jgi:hypothetical protein
MLHGAAQGSGTRPLLLEEGNHMRQDGIVVHYHPSTYASAASASGSQNVISIDWYMAIDIANSVRACSC